MTIEIFKLVTGEELIAKVDDNSMCEMFTLSQPRVMQVMQTERGMSAALVPWLLTNPDADVIIKGVHIIARAKCPDDVERSYLQQTSKLDLTSTL